MSNSRMIVAIALGVSAVGLLAQLGAQPEAGGWGPGTNYARLYNPRSVETIAGEVVAVDRFTPAKSASYGIHLTLNAGTEKITVHLGPGWFIERQAIKIAAGDRIEVQGSRITYEGKPVVIAAVVTKRNQQLKLRSTNGVPLWSGGKRK